MVHSIANLGRSLAPVLLVVALATPSSRAQGFAFGGFNNGFGGGGFNGGGFGQGGGFAYGYSGNNGGFGGNRSYNPNRIVTPPFSGYRPTTMNNLGGLSAAIDRQVVNRAGAGAAPIRRRRR